MVENAIKIKSELKTNVGASVEIPKTSSVQKNWSPAICNCENRKYLASAIGDSVITCHEIIVIQWLRVTKIF